MCTLNYIILYKYSIILTWCCIAEAIRSKKINFNLPQFSWALAYQVSKIKKIKVFTEFCLPALPIYTTKNINNNTKQNKR